MRFRPFRNSDPPALTRLWNRSSPASGIVRPLRVHELDVHAFGQVNFDPDGLIVAERDGRIVGFVHAGFGPDLPVEATRPLSLCHALGTIAMLVVEPDQESAVAHGLIREAERYLRGRGAQVLYAGGQFPLNPFYWGLYAGSEASGVLSTDTQFNAALDAMGYEPVSTTILLELGLSAVERHDPRAVAIRREVEVVVEEDALPAHWWQNQAISEFHLTHARLVSRIDRSPIARATTWDMNWFGREDGRSRIGLVDLEVSPEHRRRGYGRHLVSELLRLSQSFGTELAVVQTAATNESALAFYSSLDFQATDQSTLFRLPAHLRDRPGSG